MAIKTDQKERGEDIESR